MGEWLVVVGVGELWHDGINAIKVDSSAGCNNVVSFLYFCCCHWCGANGCCVVVVVMCRGCVPRVACGAVDDNGIGLLDTSGAKGHDTSSAIIGSVIGMCGEEEQLEGAESLPSSWCWTASSGQST